MSQIDVKLNSGNTFQVAGHSVFEIERSSTGMFLTLHDGTAFAILNKHMTEVLNSVIDLPSVQLEGLANLTMLRETISRATRAHDATSHVNINVYGSRDARKKLGCLLSAGKIYLQHPDQQRPGSVYDNPHFLAFPGMEDQSVNFKPQDESVLLGNDADKFRKAVSDLYGSLKRSSHLKRALGDARLRTPLLP